MVEKAMMDTVLTDVERLLILKLSAYKVRLAPCMGCMLWFAGGGGGRILAITSITIGISPSIPITCVALVHGASAS
jgi:hypothetical protein